jgi:hypothetical protein
MRDTIGNGFLGVASSLAAAGITLANVEVWLRIAGSLGALLVTVLTIVNLVRGLRQQNKKP